MYDAFIKEKGDWEKQVEAGKKEVEERKVVIVDLEKRVQVATEVIKEFTGLLEKHGIRNEVDKAETRISDNKAGTGVQ